MIEYDLTYGDSSQTDHHNHQNPYLSTECPCATRSTDNKIERPTSNSGMDMKNIRHIADTRAPL